MFVSCRDIQVQWMFQAPSIVIVFMWKMSIYFYKEQHHITRIHGSFVLSSYSIHLPSFFEKISYHWYLHTKHACLPVNFYNWTYWCNSSGLLNLLLVNTGFFLFYIFPAFRLFFTLTSSSFSASYSSTVLDIIFRVLEV